MAKHTHHKIVDYYKILKVDKDATTEDIEQAYKKLATRYHPNKRKSIKSQKKFIDINNAYQVLSNSDKREEYDNCVAHGSKFVYHFEDPLDIFEEFMAIYKIRHEFESKINDALNYVDFETGEIINRELILIDNNPYERIEEIKNGQKWVTYQHSDGVTQTVLSNEKLNELIDGGLC